MGIFIKLIIFGLVVVGLVWAYGNAKIDTMEVCMSPEEEVIPITCQLQEDCVMYLTSAYAVGYPRSELFTAILTEVSSCQDGHCYLRSFDFADNRLNKRCEPEETSLPYKVTYKDAVAIKGGVI